MLKVSIITVVYNNKLHIKDCIESVLRQNYKNIEYIIIDGGSTDGTIDVVKQYLSKIAKFISEKDTGIYDAMNKGISIATGDIIGFLNSDDMYANDGVLANVVSVFNSGNVDSVYGDLVYVSRNNKEKTIRYWNAGQYYPGAFRKGWHPPHTAFFVKKTVYEKYGNFDLDFKIAGDYEIMLRFLEKYKISTSYIKKVLVKMRLGGKSNSSISNIIKANLECYRAWGRNNMYITPAIFILKPIRKVLQLLALFHEPKNVTRD